MTMALLNIARSYIANFMRLGLPFLFVLLILLFTQYAQNLVAISLGYSHFYTIQCENCEERTTLITLIRLLDAPPLISNRKTTLLYLVIDDMKDIKSSVVIWSYYIFVFNKLKIECNLLLVFSNISILFAKNFVT